MMGVRGWKKRHMLKGKPKSKERCEKEGEGYKRIEFDVNAIIHHEWIKLNTTVHCTEDQLSQW